jgi:flagellar assembly protein FliH
MGLIKRELLEDKGILTIEKKMPIMPREVRPIVPETIVPAMPDVPSGPVASEEDVQKARNKAEEIAQKILNEAKSKAEGIKEEAQEAGKQEGRQEAAATIEKAMETLNQAVIERKKIIKDSEGEILRLALKITEQIIRSEVSLHRDVCLNIVSEAIARVSDREQIIVKVNREDAEYLKRYKDRLAGMLDGVKSFSIIEDANIEPGGCVIETNLGFIDARIATKLKSIEEVLNKVSETENNKKDENKESSENEEEPSNLEESPQQEES